MMRSAPVVILMMISAAVVTKFDEVVVGNVHQTNHLGYGFVYK